MNYKRTVKKLLVVCAVLFGVLIGIPQATVLAAGINASEDLIDAPEIMPNKTYSIDYRGNKNADINMSDDGEYRYVKVSITKANDYYLQGLTMSGSSFRATLYNEDMTERTSVDAYKGSAAQVSSLYLDKGTYYIRISVWSEDIYAKLSLTSIGKPKKVTDVTAKESSWSWSNNKQMDVNWTEQNGVSGYQVQYSLQSSMKKAKTVKTEDHSARIEKLKSGKKYYVRVRAYNESSSGKKYYSAWSKVKSVKISKK
jgi:hypothetical protein